MDFKVLGKKLIGLSGEKSIHFALFSLLCNVAISLFQEYWHITSNQTKNFLIIGSDLYAFSIDGN